MLSCYVAPGTLDGAGGKSGTIAVEQLPPTLAEAGLPQLSIGSWAALYGPPGLPRDIVDRMNAEFLAAASRPEVRATMMRQLFVFTGSSSDDLARFTRDQYEGFKGKMKAIGLRRTKVGHRSAVPGAGWGYGTHFKQAHDVNYRRP